MKIKERVLVNLSHKNISDLLGHITTYEKSNGNIYAVYYIEERYFGFKETDPSGNIIEEGRMNEEYDYIIDRIFDLPERRICSDF